MVPSKASEHDDTQAEFVYCANCGSKAPTSWSFCRSCESSLDDARPATTEVSDLQSDDFDGIDETGCPKCGHEEAEIDDIATTGVGLSRLFDIQTRRFRVVTCTNCGYSELYRGQDGDIIVDLFLG